MYYLQKKIFRSLLISLFVFTPLSFIRINTVYAQVPSLNFSPAEVYVDEGETFTADVVVDTAGEEVGGVGAKLIYDPSMISILSIKEGSMFNQYPAITSDDAKGNVYVSGIVSSTNDLFTGEGVFATIDFLAKSKGSTSVIFDYDPAGSTKDSNIAVMHGTGDVLGQVNDLRIAIGDASLPDIYDYKSGGGTVGEWFDSENMGADSQQEDTVLTEDGGFVDRVLKKLGLKSDEVSKDGTVAGELSAETRNPVLFYVIIFIIAILVIVIILAIVKRKRKKETSTPTIISGDI